LFTKGAFKKRPKKRVAGSGKRKKGGKKVLDKVTREGHEFLRRKRGKKKVAFGPKGGLLADEQWGGSTRWGGGGGLPDKKKKHGAPKKNKKKTRTL